MSSTTDETCETMLTYSESVPLRASLIFNWLILIPSFPVIGYSLHHFLSRRIFHKNTQTQIVVHLSALLVHCSGRCLILRFLYNAGQAVISMTPISVTLERFIAVEYSKGYESCPFGYGLFLAFLQLFLATAFLLTRYVHAAFVPSSFTFYYCQTLVSGSISTAETVIPLYLVVISQILSMIAFRGLETRNKKLRAVSDINLSTRFTLDQGVRSFSALKYFINFNCIMVSLVTFGLSTLHFFTSYFTKPTYMAIVEMTHAIPLYGISVCVGVWWQMRSLNGEQRRNITMAMRGHAMHTDLYFEMFAKQLAT
ncbi:unnamed protein product [Caenorhabditis sp. 36 PRJEB53466]|nr:unnamed protein product [Caenorhabditis sp. 36 PRJEB53466]